MARKMAYTFFARLCVLAQCGPKFSGIIQESLAIYCESILIMAETGFS